jgi:hypothetical protein
MESSSAGGPCVKKWSWLVCVLVAVPSSAADEHDLDIDFGEAKPSRLQLEADLCQAHLRLRVNRAMQRDYESKAGEEAWLEMLETFQQEAREGQRELEGYQEQFRKHFGQNFDTRTCGDDSTAHTAFEKLSAGLPSDPKALEEYVAIVPEPNVVLAACGLKAAAEQQAKTRTLANALDVSKPGAKATKPAKKGKAKAEPTPTAAPVPAPSSAGLQRLEEAYSKRFGKTLDLSRCPG